MIWCKRVIDTGMIDGKYAPHAGLEIRAGKLDQQGMINHGTHAQCQ